LLAARGHKLHRPVNSAIVATWINGYDDGMNAIAITIICCITA
jgi:hypothetical protein